MFELLKKALKSVYENRRFFMILVAFNVIGVMTVTALPFQYNSLQEDDLALELNDLTPEQKEVRVKLAKSTIIRHEIKSGESLNTIFNKHLLEQKNLEKILQANKNYAKRLNSIVKGGLLKITLDENNQVVEFIYKHNLTDGVKFVLSGDEYKFFPYQLEMEPTNRFVAGKIENSLYVSALEAGLTAGQVLELAQIFSYDVDFTYDLRAGDSYKVMFDDYYHKGVLVKKGKIKVAQLTLSGKVHQAILYTDKQNNSFYLTPDGKNLKSRFLRMPVDFGRISSHFSLRRKHPVLHTIRAHKGIDYAAKRGTPIKSVANGRIKTRRSMNGYGRTVVIDHGDGYSTLYAHMSKFSKLKVGQRVKQGDVIGYVGSSGLATGNHVHYEFRINGVHKNPLKIKVPRKKRLSSQEMSHFKKYSNDLLASFASYNEVASEVASNNPPQSSSSF